LTEFKVGDWVEITGWGGSNGTKLQIREVPTPEDRFYRFEGKDNYYGFTDTYLKASKALKAAKAAHPSKGKVDVVNDPVNKPAHYTQYPVEVIELTRHMSFNRGNAVKYVARAGFKDKATEKQDIEKAIWYLQDDLKELERKAAAK
jgi:hypothetical protein